MADGIVQRIEGWDDLLLDEHDVDDTIEQAVTVVTGVLGGGVSASITVRPPGGDTAQTRGATDETALRLDEWQYAHGEGPCVTADREGAMCVVPDLHDDESFPAFAEVALAMGVEGVASFPLLGAGQSIGSLNLFTSETGWIDEERVELGLRLAVMLSPLLANFLTHQRVVRVRDQLEEALVHRADIEQAKGLLMARLGVSADDAFELLSAQSQHENRKLRVVAADLVEQHERDVAGD